MIDAHDALTRAHRDEWARVVATLAKRFGNLDIAEDAAADAFASAAEHWPAEGIPPRPGAWLTATATRKAIDRIRRESSRDARHREAQLVYDADPEPLGAIDDDRITRAKSKIAAAGIPYRVPGVEDLPGRLAGVLTVLFLIFNEGYLASGPDSAPVREDLTGEAIRLARLLHQLLPDDGEATGMLALMLLTDARRPARVSSAGELMPLGEQDRGQWDAESIAEGHALVRARLASGMPPGRYQLLAAINAVHTDGDATDWTQVVALYDHLLRLDRSPIVRLNRAIAVSERDGREPGLALVDALRPELESYHPYHAARAELLRRLGRPAEAAAAYDAALALASNTAEVAYLTRQRDSTRPG
ncbi:DUF6596 domain-containing protein [Microbacterium sp. LWS13-1.2]|uniref:RNA polymerase sigma factor n=1 Tax=Microbacterium sp. LWS13-1.2 TaxID=3135264 RepID=A0AAU6SEH2_9MICO